MEKITWEQFEAVNVDKTSSFENLCRLLFNRQFFDNKINLISKPNHPGIEVYPVLEEKSGKMISFQSKFFSGMTDYTQIQKSVEKTVKYYSGSLDIFYLYCNKDISSDSQGYKKIEELLCSAGIEIQLITNNAILDQVFKYPIISEYFFDHHSLNDIWFQEKLEQSLDAMGTRYNRKFNVSTETEKEFKLFLKNSETLKILEDKKDEAINELINLRRYLSEKDDILPRDILSRVRTFKIEDVNEIEACLNWKDTLKDEFNSQFNLTNSKIEELKELEIEDNWKKQWNRSRIQALRSLTNIPTLLEFNDLEQKLIQKKMLIINGEAGTGKSQLLSESANKIVSNGGYAILLPSHVFLSSETVQSQVLSQLGLSIDFREFLDILEMTGELTNQNTYLFIDAINESSNREIWKNGLSMIFREIEKLNFVKIVVSLRSGYEDMVLDESIREKIAEHEIPEITHNGFWNNSIEAVKEFLNYHQIPFSPSYSFQSEMANPLFLTMFCKVYDGNDFDLYQLLEKFLEKADRDAQKAIGIQDFLPILNDLVKEIADFQLENGLYAVGRNDILKMEFWDLHGLSNKKLQYLSSLGKSGVFVTFMREGEEKYRFGYNLLKDFICAKVIINRFSSAQECREYLRNDLLKIGNKERKVWENADVFIVATNLFFEKFGEECIDIANDITDEYDRNHLLDEYIKSFSWRPSQNIDLKNFREFISKNRISHNTVFNVLIENSVKSNNPLNAEFLHEILFNKLLNERDYMWTTYINNFAYEDDRLFQLISLFDKGKKLENSSENTWLLLVLFSWLLTSSNRLLRDKASKAMIELLKDDFSLILPLLKKFENVNDPYVIQRLYGVVFGACTKNLNMTEPEFKELAEYVYIAIFDKDLVYPDILLRDYAKLIIEYFLFKFPESKTIINQITFRPPYNSKPIPIAKKAKDKYEGGLNIIAHSIAPEGVERMYGDFGRYVFDSALHHFSDVDSVNIYNYSMDFIENELGYKNKLFAEHDSLRNRNSYDRHNTGKIERIGKKYQWITMYNILARVSDHYKLSDGYGWNNSEEPEEFDGAWNPYVRDFDPTLNRNFLDDPSCPLFAKKELKVLDFISKDASKEVVKKWVSNEDDVFFTAGPDLLLLDESQTEWVALDDYMSIKNTDDELDLISIGDRSGKQEKWLIADGYFIKKSEFSDLQNDLSSKNLRKISFPESSGNIYQLFNREYGWSSGYKRSVADRSWSDYEVETGKFDTIEYPSFNISIIDDIDDDELETLEYMNENTEKYKVPIKKSLARVMSATDSFLWEEQYDASQKETTSFDIPCSLLISELELVQREYDGYYYDKSGELVALYIKDSEEFDSSHRFLIRKGHLNKFLAQNELTLFWICRGEKDFMVQEIREQEWSEWGGLLYLSNDKIVGEIVKFDRI